MSQNVGLSGDCVGLAALAGMNVLLCCYVKLHLTFVSDKLSSTLD